jgi:hypothetical protein
MPKPPASARARRVASALSSAKGQPLAIRDHALGSSAVRAQNASKKIGSVGGRLVTIGPACSSSRPIWIAAALSGDGRKHRVEPLSSSLGIKASPLFALPFTAPPL